MASHARYVRRLYKQIVFHARRFPSIKKESILADIRTGGVKQWGLPLTKEGYCRHSHQTTNSAALLYGVAEFRENASLTDMEKIKQCVATAELSLSQLQKYG